MLFFRKLKLVIPQVFSQEHFFTHYFFDGDATF